MVRVIGLNSGSSFDGIDVVLVEIGNGPDGYPARPKFIMGKSYDWPQAVADIVLKSFENKISILIRNAGGKVELDVADNGPGIPEGALKRIFDPFYTTKEEAGTGLGLAISKTIAQEHGGDLTAENLSSGGARFRLSLPATE